MGYQLLSIEHLVLGLWARWSGWTASSVEMRWMGRAPKAFCGVVMPVEPSVMVFMVGSSPQPQYIYIKGYHLGA